jgi:GH24 family phage-related lysozyme (muramidase)
VNKPTELHPLTLAQIEDEQTAALIEYSFRMGAQACREVMARFVEQGGDEATAQSIRLNWHSGWGTDPGQLNEVPRNALEEYEPREGPSKFADAAVAHARALTTDTTGGQR